jgi:protein SCO1/2
LSQASLPRRTTLLGLWIVLALSGLVGAAAAVRSRLSEAALPPVLGTLPAYTLVDSAGRELGPARFAGRPFVADFIFTRCAGVCPAMTARLARLRRELPAEVRVVSFTVDPAHDTPEALRDYARAHGAGDDWVFATGSREALHALATRGFKLAAYEVPPEERQDGGDGPFLHSSKFVLVDGEGRVRGYYDSADEAAVATLQREAHALVGAPR